jgi:hypothetical protein
MRYKGGRLANRQRRYRAAGGLSKSLEVATARQVTGRHFVKFAKNPFLKLSPIRDQLIDLHKKYYDDG